jgi:hypothetical protein
MDSRDCLAHYPFSSSGSFAASVRGRVPIVLLDWQRNLGLRSACFLLRLPLAGQGAVKKEGQVGLWRLLARSRADAAARHAAWACQAAARQETDRIIVGRGGRARKARADDVSETRVGDQLRSCNVHIGSVLTFIPSGPPRQASPRAEDGDEVNFAFNIGAVADDRRGVAVRHDDGPKAYN